MQIYRISIESNEKYKNSQKGNKLNTFLYYNGMASLLNYFFFFFFGRVWHVIGGIHQVMRLDVIREDTFKNTSGATICLKSHREKVVGHSWVHFASSVVFSPLAISFSFSSARSGGPVGLSNCHIITAQTISATSRPCQSFLHLQLIKKLPRNVFLQPCPHAFCLGPRWCFKVLKRESISHCQAVFYLVYCIYTHCEWLIGAHYSMFDLKSFFAVA